MATARKSSTAISSDTPKTANPPKPPRLVDFQNESRNHEWDHLFCERANVSPDNLPDLVMKAMTVFWRHGVRSIEMFASCLLTELNGIQPTFDNSGLVPLLVVSTNAQYRPGQIWNAIDSLTDLKKIRIIRPLPKQIPDSHGGVLYTENYEHHEQWNFAVIEHVPPKSDSSPSDLVTIKQLYARIILEEWSYQPPSEAALSAMLRTKKIVATVPGKRGAGNVAKYNYNDVKNALGK